ncbi:MAG TPA: 50S ribosomal protein L24 [Candidatus Dormibacteraeota bacterium]|nr:50S ribosomal protein L24 [Candidatus Dormibacteraeota bacterium]
MAAERVTGQTRTPEIRKGDTVVVLSGKDAGKRGVVDRVIRRDAAPTTLPSAYRRASSRGGVYVVVENTNIAKKHTKPRQRSTSGGSIAGVPTVEPGGILDVAQPLPVSKVMLVCPKCERPTRVAHQFLDSGARVRVCRHCGEQLEVTK